MHCFTGGRTVRFRASFCLILYCVFFASIPGFAGDQQWVEVRSPNFSVITDAGEKKGRDVALHFEQMRSVFGRLMAKATVNLPVPLQIVAFRNTKEIRQMAPIFNGKPTEVSGLFQGGQDRSFIMLDTSVEDPWSVVFHEYAHRLLDGNLSVRTDPWFEEGFAEYFSSIEVDNKEARVGKIPNDTYLILQQMGMMKVSDLLRVQQYSKTYNESGSHRTTFYAESSLVVHYVYDHSLIERLTAYFDALKVQKKSVDESIQIAFGMNPDQFDHKIHEYLNAGKYQYHPMATPAGIVPSQFTVSPFSSIDARATLADIHAHSPDYRAHALEEFLEILKTDPENALALRGAGFAYLQQRDFEHAEDYFHRAVQKNSKDARVHFYYAMMLQQRGSFQDSSTGEFKRELEAAIALDPTFADAYSMLGFAQASSGEREKGIATMKKAIELSPRNESYLFNLANVYMMDQKIDAAITIFRYLAASDNEGMAARANQSIQQAMDFKQRKQEFEAQFKQSTDTGRPALVTKPSSEPANTDPEPGPAPVKVHVATVRFIKGKLVSVDCSSAPKAVLAITAGSKSLKLQVQDKAHVIVMGADNFSCDWKGKNVAVNYRESTESDGEVVSLEIQ
jgi:tetratricopeptide (TPR) repeat protein